MVLESAVSPAPVAASIQARYEALFRVSRTISAHRDPEKLFQSLAEELRGVVEFDAIYCIHYDPAAGSSEFCMIETPGGRVPKQDFRPEETPTGWVYEHQKPLVIPCVESETRFPRVMALLRNEGIRSLASLPLKTAHRRLGCFGVGSTQPDAYSPEEVEFLSLVADQVALAIDDAFHFDQLQQEKDRLKLLLDLSNAVSSNLELPDLLRAISASLRLIMQSDGAGVALLDRESNQLRLCVIDFPGNNGHVMEGQLLEDDHPAAQAVRTSEPVVAEMTKGGETKSICHVPLMSRDRVLGALGVGRSTPLSSKELAFLKQLAGQVAIAVENALGLRPDRRVERQARAGEAISRR